MPEKNNIIWPYLKQFKYYQIVSYKSWIMVWSEKRFLFLHMIYLCGLFICKEFEHNGLPWWLSW